MNIFNNANIAKIPTPKISAEMDELTKALIQQKNVPAKNIPAPPPFKPNAAPVQPLVQKPIPPLVKQPTSLSVVPPPLTNTSSVSVPPPPLPVSVPKLTPTSSAIITEPTLSLSSTTDNEGKGWLGYLFIFLGLAIIVYLVYRIGILIYNKYKDKLSLSKLDDEIDSLIHPSTKKAVVTEEEEPIPLPTKQQQPTTTKTRTTTSSTKNQHPDKCSTKQEVFNISNNVFKYDDAHAVCRAVGARLATLDEVKEAYRNGADWCNYGWTEGQMAVYPTQKETWVKLQQGPEEHRKDCGVVGINGGYFDNKNLRFGVNCYGVKRIPTEKEQNLNFFNPDYTTKEERETQEKIEKYKLQLNDINIMPFNKLDWIQGGSNDKYCKINN